eukprot:5581731-Alexandrium_andersonii.AAC.1
MAQAYPSPTFPHPQESVKSIMTHQKGLLGEAVKGPSIQPAIASQTFVVHLFQASASASAGSAPKLQ